MGFNGTKIALTLEGVVRAGAALEHAQWVEAPRWVDESKRNYSVWADWIELV